MAGKARSRKLGVTTLAVLIAIIGICTSTILNDAKSNDECTANETINEDIVNETDISANDNVSVAMEPLNNVVAYSSEEDQVISEILDETDQLSASGDLEGAMAVISQGVMDHPNSPTLMVKQAEIATELNEKVRDEVLSSAEELANLEDYGSAIAMIKTAQETMQFSEYEEALSRYIPVYQEKVITDADLAADRGDYVSAIRKVGEAVSVSGESEVLEAKGNEYVGYYMYDTNKAVEACLQEGDFTGADRLVDNANSILGDDCEAVRELKERIDHLRPVNGEEIIRLLEEGVISQSGTTKFYRGTNYINAFSDRRYNCFSVNTACWYNLWGGNVQTLDLKVSNLPFQTLTFTVAGETGSSGSSVVDVFFDRPIDESEPDIRIPMENVSFPVQGAVSIEGHTTMSIRVTNAASNENRIVFYDFVGYNTL